MEIQRVSINSNTASIFPGICYFLLQYFESTINRSCSVPMNPLQQRCTRRRVAPATRPLHFSPSWWLSAATILYALKRMQHHEAPPTNSCVFLNSLSVCKASNTLRYILIYRHLNSNTTSNLKRSIHQTSISQPNLKRASNPPNKPQTCNRPK